MARTGRPSVAVVLDSEEREVLERYVRRRKTAARLAMRARIVLLCSEGWTNREIASKLNVTPGTASKWRGRFARKRLHGLLEEPRVGTPRRIGDDQIEKIVVDTLESTPRNATHWSTRGRRTELSPSCCRRIPSSSKRCGTWWACICTRPSRPWSCASTKHLKSRHSIVHSPCCRCAPANPNGGRPTTRGTGPARCSPRWTLRPAR